MYVYMATDDASLHSLAQQARTQRLQGDHHGDSPFPLTGYCFDNAFVLRHILEQHGYQPHLVVGLAERYAESLLRDVQPSGLTTVEDLAGYVHYWVEVEDTVVDIAPELETHLGEVYVGSLPDSYHRMKDSYEEGNATYHSAMGRRCVVCGGEESRCGCERDD